MKLKDKDVEFLSSIQNRGGEATTSEIRDDLSDWTRDQIDYRFDKLERADLIYVRKDNSLTHEGEPPMRVAEISPEARERLSEDETETEVGKRHDELEELRDKIDELESETEEMREKFNEAVVPRMYALEEVVGDHVDEDIGKEIEKKREEIFD